jgi:hypothetical protein
MMPWPPALTVLLAREAGVAVPPAVAALAQSAAAAVGPSTVAILFYGSALRDGTVGDRLVDLYVLTDGYAGLRGPWLWRKLVRVLPPNVYYVETACDGGTVRAKYAVVSLGHLERLVGRGTRNPYFWARFAQPTGLVWARDQAVRERLLNALAQSSDTLLAAARPLLPRSIEPASLWERAFTETYRTELRSEPPGRSRAVYEAASDRYDEIAALLHDRPPEPVSPAGAAGRWARRRLVGKSLSVLRLAKAAFTFSGGADYIAWKITRHSGVPIELTDWQRRHPLLAGIKLFWRLYRQRAFR